MRWRNEQLYHLRQKEPLTSEQQDRYFNTVVAALFDQQEPEQILFSFLKNGECIGYGGLVHINWVDRNAELSFIMDTSLERDHFQEYWGVFLGLIEKVAFSELELHKVYTWAFDIRPKLYEVLLANAFEQEAKLKEHSILSGKYVDVIIHSKIINVFLLREAKSDDVEVTYTWASNTLIRRYSKNNTEIKWEGHRDWFQEKLKDNNSIFLIAEYAGVPAGLFRIDHITPEVGGISYLLDIEFQGLGLGKKLMEYGIRYAMDQTNIGCLVGEVHKDNIPSIRVFQNSGFVKARENKGFILFEKKLR